MKLRVSVWNVFKSMPLLRTLFKWCKDLLFGPDWCDICWSVMYCILIHMYSIDLCLVSCMYRSDMYAVNLWLISLKCNIMWFFARFWDRFSLVTTCKGCFFGVNFISLSIFSDSWNCHFSAQCHMQKYSFFSGISWKYQNTHAIMLKSKWCFFFTFALAFS